MSLRSVEILVSLPMGSAILFYFTSLTPAMLCYRSTNLSISFPVAIFCFETIRAIATPS